MSCPRVTEHATSAWTNAESNFAFQFRHFCYIVLLLSVTCVNLSSAMLDWPRHLSGQREPYLELFAQVGLRKEQKENSATLPDECEKSHAVVLTACG